MFTAILGGLAILAIAAVVVLLTPAEPWELDGEVWYEQLGSRPVSDPVADELRIMRIEAEAEAIAAARKSSRPRAVVAKLSES